MNKKTKQLSLAAVMSALCFIMIIERKSKLVNECFGGVFMIKWPEIQYREAEDGMLYPIIDFPKQPAGDIGKYGSMRRVYLEKHRPATYQMMILEGTLKQHLLEVITQAHEMLEQLIEGMKRSEGITEHLKSSNQLEWVQRMNSVKHRAEILIQKELIFT